MVKVLNQEQGKREKKSTAEKDLVQLTIRIPEDLYRAYQRGCWIVSQESGRSRDELAQEMITDFLVKHGC